MKSVRRTLFCDPLYIISNKELVKFDGEVTLVVQVFRAGTMEARENAAVTLFYPYAILWKQDHTRQCDTCLIGPSREWVSKRQE